MRTADRDELMRLELAKAFEPKPRQRVTRGQFVQCQCGAMRKPKRDTVRCARCRDCGIID